MKVEVITSEKDTLEFYIDGERHTLPNLLKDKLVDNADVDFVAYKLDHPIDQKSRFIVKGKNPKKIIETAIKEIESELAEFQKAFEKA